MQIMFKKIKIGVTVHPNMDLLFNNGNYQNAISLLSLLEENKNFEVFPVAHQSEIKKVKEAKGKFLSFTDCANRKLDLLLCPIWSPSGNLYATLRSKNVQVIDVTYGNRYASMLSNFYGYGVGDHFYCDYQSEGKIVWTSPHYSSQIELLQVVKGAKNPVKICPYIWNPAFFKAKMGKTDNFFMDHKNKKSIAIIEPNINYTKNAISPAVTIIDYYRRNGFNKGEDVNFYGMRTKEHNKKLINFLSEGAGESIKKHISFEKRKPIKEILNKSAICLSHHRDNSLNYTTLESLYLGLPVIHNSDHIKAGYRYNSFESIKASLLLESAMNHEEILDRYVEEAKEEIYKYSPENPKNKKGYFDLIYEAMDVKNK